jgi:hypothetical protein
LAKAGFEQVAGALGVLGTVEQVGIDAEGCVGEAWPSWRETNTTFAPWAINRLANVTQLMEAKRRLHRVASQPRSPGRLLELISSSPAAERLPSRPGATINDPTATAYETLACIPIKIPQEWNRRPHPDWPTFQTKSLGLRPQGRSTIAEIDTALVLQNPSPPP